MRRQARDVLKEERGFGILQGLQTLRIRHIHPAELAAPEVEARVREPVLTAQLLTAMPCSASVRSSGAYSALSSPSHPASFSVSTRGRRMKLRNSRKRSKERAAFMFAVRHDLLPVQLLTGHWPWFN